MIQRQLTRNTILEAVCIPTELNFQDRFLELMEGFDVSEQEKEFFNRLPTLTLLEIYNERETVNC